MQARFDFETGDGRAPLHFRHPDRLIVAHTVEEVPAAMAAVEQGLRDGLYAAGYVSYEAASAFDPALTTQKPSAFPLVCFGLFPGVEEAPALEEGPLPVSTLWTPALSADDHAHAVAAVREAIAAGDTYQTNFTFRLNATLDVAALDSLYQHLARAERVPYAASVDTGEWRLLSLSPELFFKVDGAHLVTRPMKGTAARGRWAEEDVALRDELWASEKNRAENVMIVDLCRNDLSRVCEIGSVRATSLFDVEPYPTVWQMVSTVEGELTPGTRLSDIFAALFPAGSITGAPKSSSMRLIAALEHAPRGVYCGAIGFATPDGHATFNVAIRTMTVNAETGRAEYGVGGGITWDSVAAAEHAEALNKAACLAVRPPFALIETLRAEEGTLVRADRHLARLTESAAFFGFPCDMKLLRLRLERCAAAHPVGRWRVRLELDAHGRAAVECRPLEETAPEPQAIVLASRSVDSRDRFLCHKTTRRDVYDHHGAAHPAAFDVLLWNERRELTEFTRGNLVAELDGMLCTPSRASGLLAGVFRAELLDAGTIRERVLMVDDLPRCTKLWFINSLREWVPVHQ
ncbi:MAG TPA: aminodeoxychorismate synthase component I [Vicinamibacterales bacterium]|nr:aminodeoxychorismate synthase component I [Vicinamibacterales bacterium]